LNTKSMKDRLIYSENRAADNGLFIAGRIFKMRAAQKRTIQLMGAAMMVLLLAFNSGCKKSTETSAQQPTPRTDQQIASDVQAKINGESALNGQNIQVAVQDSKVTLSGQANDDASRALAANDAGSVDGVKQVLNNLEVQPQAAAAPAPPPPTPEIHEKKKKKSAGTELQEPVQQQPIAPPPAQEQVKTVPPPAPPAPPQPVVKTVTLPVGTVIPIRMTDSLDSANAQPNQTFRGSLAGDLIADGMVAIPQGASVTGRVVDAKDAGHFSGSSLLSIELTSINAHGQRVQVVTDSYSKQGSGRGANTAKKAGGGAALGAIIGALAGGGKGAAIGAAAGGGLGAGVNGVTRGQQVQIPSETLVNFRLQSPINVTTSQNIRSYDNTQLQQR
jgi:BON domain